MVEMSLRSYRDPLPGLKRGGHHFIGETMILDLDRLRQPLILDTLEWVQPS